MKKLPNNEICGFCGGRSEVFEGGEIKVAPLENGLCSQCAIKRNVMVKESKQRTDISKQLDKRAGKEIENKSEFTELLQGTDITKQII